MKVLVALMLSANALIAQHGGFGGGYRGGGGGRGPAMGGGFVRGYSGGGFRVGVGGGYHGHYPGYRPGYYPQHGYYRPYPYRRYISPYAGYGGPVYSVGYYGYGYGSPFWSNIGTYGSSAYAYPNFPGPSISVITVPNLPDPGPSVVITNNRAPYEERSAPAPDRRRKEPDESSERKTSAPRSPIYLIATTNGTIWGALSYSVENGKVDFFTIRGDRRSLALSDVDRVLTAELNAQAGITLRLP